MSDVAFNIGIVVMCKDGECGMLARVVIDSSTHAITHLVVEPKHRRHDARLVPMDLVEAISSQEIRLECTLEQFEGLDAAEETNIRPEARFDWEDQRAQALTVGFSRYLGPRVLDSDGLGTGRMPTRPLGLTEDKIPGAEGEIWRGQHVHASDGAIGHVYGFVIDPRDRVTHVLLGEGHLWGKKEVAIPISAVKFIVDDGVYLTLTKQEVGDLPPASPVVDDAG
jgi:sporulation protein YlmC with PRC-barrel domain